MKARVFLILSFFLAGIVLFVMLRRAGEPVYRGHPISYWIEPWQHHGMEPAENIAAAFAAMDERAVEWFAGELDWRPSRLRAQLNGMVARVISAKFFDDPPDRREVAAMGLGRLGPRAISAAPALEAAWREAAEPRASSSRAAALAALIAIRQERLEPYLEKLRDLRSPDWTIYAWAMWHLGTNAAPAVPRLVEALNQAPNDWTALTAASALATIRSRPELTIPCLVRVLAHTNPNIRYHAVRGLGGFGAAARPVRAAIVTRLEDPRVEVRQAATNALRHVD